MGPKHYIVIKIEGEYATLKDTETGDELFIAMALLPEETDIGVKLCGKISPTPQSKEKICLKI